MILTRKKPKYSEKGLSQYHLVHHKSHMDRLVTEAEPPQGEAGA
jgi:hypothetical protein